MLSHLARLWIKTSEKVDSARLTNPKYSIEHAGLRPACAVSSFSFFPLLSLVSRSAYAAWVCESSVDGRFRLGTAGFSWAIARLHGVAAGHHSLRWDAWHQKLRRRGHKEAQEKLKTTRVTSSSITRFFWTISCIQSPTREDLVALDVQAPRSR